MTSRTTPRNNEDLGRHASSVLGLKVMAYSAKTGTPEACVPRDFPKTWERTLLACRNYGKGSTKLIGAVAWSEHARMRALPGI